MLDVLQTQLDRTVAANPLALPAEVKALAKTFACICRDYENRIAALERRASAVDPSALERMFSHG
jgi:hypothetical protein